MAMKKIETLTELVFWLDERYVCKEREREVERCYRELPAEGLPVFVRGDPAEGACCLYLTDSAVLYQRCREKGLPAAGYLHAGNRQESFPGAEYILMQPDEISADSYCKIWQRLAGHPWIIARTKRLTLQEVSPEDYEALYLLYDAQARRFLTPLSEDREKEQEILRVYAEKIYGFYGYGMWGIWETASGELIGRIGFAPPTEAKGIPELGYLVRKDCRGKGYAKEAARAALTFAKDELGIAEVALQTDAANAASVALAMSLGFQVEEKTTVGATGKVLHWTKTLLNERKGNHD